MRKFRTVFLFELKSYLKNKVIVGITLFLILAAAVLLSFPRLSNSGGPGPKQENTTEKPVMMILPDREEEAGRLRNVFAAAFPDYDVRETDLPAETIREQIRADTINCAFVFQGTDACTYYVNNLGMNDQTARKASAILQENYRRNRIIQNGVAPEQADMIMNSSISVDTVKLGKDQSQTFFYTYIMIFALYMVILLYGQMIATNVATEKSSRIMELLVTSTDTNSMIFGKVLASCLVGFVQLGLVFGLSIMFYNLNRKFWTDDLIINSIFNLPPDLLLYMLLFFVLGFLVYAFLYGAVGSTVSRLEDTNTAVIPLTFLFMISFFLVLIPLAGGDINSLLIIICSFVPFTSPMAMFTRIAMGSVPAIEIAGSVTILVLSAVLIGFLSARIYRIGVLLYGEKPGPGKIIVLMRNEKQV